MARIVAVLDIGKTNAKLVVHDLLEGRDLSAETRPNRVLAGPPFPHFDAQGLFDFTLDALRRAAARFAIEAICVTTHGACFVLLDADGDLACPILDYEHDGPDELGAEYDAVRPAFTETFSPRLPKGLNAGAQLFWLERRFPAAFARTRTILPYPQYWVYRLTGVLACEATSLGCHTDLWRPASGEFSSLVERMDWRHRFPRVRPAFDVAGPLQPHIASSVGLGDRTIPVHVGIHDSNASLLPHLLDGQPPLSVVSTGTWVIAFAAGGSLARLDPFADMLANVDAFGRPVPSARFMGGREFDCLTTHDAVPPTQRELARVLADPVMIHPTFAAGTGPFPNRPGCWSLDEGELTSGERTAAASLYVAMMTAQILKAMAAGGPTHVEGPFASNALFLDALATATGRSVHASSLPSGTSGGAARLAAGADASSPVPHERSIASSANEELERYVERWNVVLDAGRR